MVWCGVSVSSADKLSSPDPTRSSRSLNSMNSLNSLISMVRLTRLMLEVPVCVVPLTQGEEPGASCLLAAATLPTYYTHTYIYTDTYCGTNRERRGHCWLHQGVFWRAKASQAKQSQSGTSSDRPPFFLCCVLVCLCVCLASWSWHDMKDEDV